MKPLLSKATKPFIIYVLIILTISIPIYYWVVNTIWESELDEHNKTVAEKTSYEFNRLKLSDEELNKSIKLWNHIQPETNIEHVAANAPRENLYFTINKQKNFNGKNEIERYRCLKKTVYINNQPFLFIIQTNIEESQSTIAVIAVTTIFFFIIIALGLLFLNRKLSSSIWKPFRNTLEKLKKFNLNTHPQIEFEKTDTLEFEELHESLNKLLEHSVSVYQAQKQFTENASHELQTPLTIIKHKVDILLQNENLTEEQYLIAEDINKALTRSSRINKNLLLLAKIGNNQFDNSEKIKFGVLVSQSLEMFEEHFNQKNLSVHSSIDPKIEVLGNSGLCEVLINNLLINAIRHTFQNGSISVILTESVFEVSNSGTEKLNTESLFKRFSRFSSDNNGSGLGLAIINEICKFQKWKVGYTFENNHHIFSVTF